jgi:hypothetical protein
VVGKRQGSLAVPAVYTSYRWRAGLSAGIAPNDTKKPSVPCR